MHDDVARIDQHPVAHGLALGAHLLSGFPRDALDQMLGDGGHLAGGPARGDDEEIGDRGFAGQVDGDDVFRLVVVQRFQDQLVQLDNRGRNGGAPGFGFGGIDRFLTALGLEAALAALVTALVTVFFFAALLADALVLEAGFAADLVFPAGFLPAELLPAEFLAVEAALGLEPAVAAARLRVVVVAMAWPS